MANQKLKLLVISLLAGFALVGCQSTGGAKRGKTGAPTQSLYVGLSEAAFLNGHYCFRPDPGFLSFLSIKGIELKTDEASPGRTYRTYNCMIDGASGYYVRFLNGSLHSYERFKGH